MKRINIENVFHDVAMTYYQSLKEIHNYLENAKGKKIIVGENQDERFLQEVETEKQNQKINDFIKNTEIKVNQIINEYSENEKLYFSPKGENLTSDIELLKLNLDEKQVKELQVRYSDNMTMLKAINDYAKEKSLNVFRVQAAESRIEILKTFNKLINPRYRENIYSDKYPFLDTCELYKNSQLKNIF